MSRLSNMAVRDIETVIHPYTNLARHRETGPLILNEGRGIYLYDDKGKRYIEGLAGLWCTALGYGNEELVEAAAAAMRKLSYTSIFTGKSHDGGDRAVGETEGDRAVPGLQSPVRRLGLRSQRHADQAHLVL